MVSRGTLPGEIRTCCSPESSIQSAFDLLRSADLEPSSAPRKGPGPRCLGTLDENVSRRRHPRLPGFPSHPGPLSIIWLWEKLWRPLREEGVFILGSGNVTHNLQTGNFHGPPSRTGGLGERFRRLGGGDVGGYFDLEKLTRYREAPGGKLSHPTDDHYVPLVAAAAAAGAHGKPNIRFPYEGFD